MLFRNMEPKQALGDTAFWGRIQGWGKVEQRILVFLSAIEIYFY